MARLTTNVFRPAQVPKATSLGAAGYDNSRENIDPHIKTKVVSSMEGTIEKVPVNDSDIANKKYVDDNDTDTTDHTLLSNIGINTHNNIDKHIQVNDSLVFNERFFSTDEVVDNGATLYGTPTVDEGIELNGTSQYVSYPGTGVYNTAEVGILIEFTPDFAIDVNQIVTFFSSTGTNYSVFKHNNSASNAIYIYMAGVDIAQIPTATYSPYWNVGEKNVLIVSGTTGNVSAWLNGNQVLTNDTTAWTQGDASAIVIGSSRTGTNKFDGKIYSFKIYQSIITPDSILSTHNEIDNHIDDDTIHYVQADIDITASQVSDFDAEVTNNITVASSATHFGGDGSDHADVATNSAKNSYTGYAGEHGTAATDMIVNVCYGTSATPPTATTTTEGTLYMQYTA